MTQQICQNCKQIFIIEPQDHAFYEKMNAPLPTFCPDCRLQRRLSFRNERTLYRNACALCKKNIISIYAPDTLLKVYCPPCWWSDTWSPKDYAREYDFKKSFFEQYKALLGEVPVLSLNTLHQTIVNSDYANQVGHVKNCYLLFNSDYNENCSYGSEIQSCKDCFNNLNIENSSRCHECINCEKCYETYFSEDCEGCHNIWFGKNLSGCSNCFGCMNLRKKQYCIWNNQYTKEEYERELEGMNIFSRKNQEEYHEKLRDLSLKHPQKYIHGRQNADVSGDYITHANKVHDSYIVREAQNCRYCMWLLVKPTKDCYDYTEYGDNAENIYESLNCGIGISNVKYSQWILSGSQNIEYSSRCFSSQNLFGCVGLRKGAYCILNKEYSKEEHEKLVANIKEHMNALPYADAAGRKYTYGEFFPSELSPFCYNETSTMDFFPLTKEEAKTKKFHWKELEEKKYVITQDPHTLPDVIAGVGDTITEKIIGCKNKTSESRPSGCSTAFKITPQELEFYRSANLPLPAFCPNCRHASRTERRNPVQLQNRICNCAGLTSKNKAYTNSSPHPHGDAPCPKEFKTTYRENDPNIIYCEECYQSEVN